LVILWTATSDEVYGWAIIKLVDGE